MGHFAPFFVAFNMVCDFAKNFQIEARQARVRILVTYGPIIALEYLAFCSVT